MNFVDWHNYIGLRSLMQNLLIHGARLHSHITLVTYGALQS
jgi:hypothetical protein